ncbi:MAG: Sbal_3080 family lipoprotein [Azoarcus sp.]|jgi:hypothetical protein|nr:Sbal_3080 family lipoprotein [Azoarcus sp.]
MKKLVLLFAIIAVNTACTSIDVTAVDPSLDMRHVCIQENPRVRVGDFVQVLEDGLMRHGLTAEVFAGKAPPHCEYTLTYTALRSWDFAPYLAHAELAIWKNARKVAEATYHLVGGGGLSMMKWQGTETKIAPVIDELLKGYVTTSPAATTVRRTREPPDPAIAPMPVPMTVPVPVSASVLRQDSPAPKLETGFYAYHAGIVPEARDCTDTPKPQLAAKGKYYEIYNIACADGDMLSVRCDPGRCRALK